MVAKHHLDVTRRTTAGPSRRATSTPSRRAAGDGRITDYAANALGDIGSSTSRGRRRGREGRGLGRGVGQGRVGDVRAHLGRGRRDQRRARGHATRKLVGARGRRAVHQGQDERRGRVGPARGRGRVRRAHGTGDARAQGGTERGGIDLALSGTAVGVDDTRVPARLGARTARRSLGDGAAAVALPLGGETSASNDSGRGRTGLSMRRRRSRGHRLRRRPAARRQMRGAEELKFIRSQQAAQGSCPKEPHSAALPPAQGTRLQRRRAQSTPGGPGTLTAAHGRGARRSSQKPRPVGR